MILFVNNNSGILFLSGIVAAIGRFLKITAMSVVEYITQVITVEDSNGTC